MKVSIIRNRNEAALAEGKEKQKPKTKQNKTRHPSSIDESEDGSRTLQVRDGAEHRRSRRRGGGVVVVVVVVGGGGGGGDGDVVVDADGGPGVAVEIFGQNELDVGDGAGLDLRRGRLGDPTEDDAFEERGQTLSDAAEVVPVLERHQVAEKLRMRQQQETWNQRIRSWSFSVSSYFKSKWYNFSSIAHSKAFRLNRKHFFSLESTRTKGGCWDKSKKTKSLSMVCWWFSFLDFLGAGHRLGASRWII